MFLNAFSCRTCSFRLLLYETEVSRNIIKCFKDGSDSVPIRCPKCGQEHRYNYFDLKIIAQAAQETTQPPEVRSL